MKQLTVIYLSITLLLQGFNPGLKDLVRVGDMLQHFEYHSQNYGDSFTEFFSKHYGAAKEAHQQDEDKDHEHKNLPFNHQTSVQIALALFIQQDKISLRKLPPEKKHSLNFIYKEGHSIPCNTDIFQPPRYL
ncbi:hypothetical protein [Salegentibacter sediminis]|uniref:hypothetical protein n=1 Tax=Salegentibacter sediminis TaxID=1930251 RepID=UPI0009BCE337|nr:hypothetical protein [Salegentibacter sediminis]